MLGVYDNIENNEADVDVHKSSASGLDKKKEIDAQQLLAQASDNKDLWGVDGQEDSSSMVGVEKMRDELKQMFKRYSKDADAPLSELLFQMARAQALECSLIINGKPPLSRLIAIHLRCVPPLRR